MLKNLHVCQLQVSVPGKTFVLGEYSVLEFGQALIATHQPGYTFTWILEGDSLTLSSPFHSESPAGILWARHQEKLTGWSLVQSNLIKSGFGSSTAEYIAVLALIANLTEQDFQSDHFIWQSFQEYVQDHLNSRPSGADLVAQLQMTKIQSMGQTANKKSQTMSPLVMQQETQLVLVDLKSQSVSVILWPFKYLQMHFYHTGEKIKTFEHLKSLSDKRQKTWLDFSELEEIRDAGTSALHDGNSRLFIQSVNQASAWLESKELMAERTRQLLIDFNQQDSVLAAKGCGALGADVILAIVEAENTWYHPQLNLSFQLSVGNQ